MKFDKNDVLLAMQKDKESFSRLYDAIYTDLFKMSFYIMGNRELAEDAVSETVMDAYKGISSIRDAELFENWILKILTNKCKRMLRIRYDKFSVFNFNARNMDDNEAVCKDQMSVSENRTDIRRAMEQLKPLDRMIISLCIVEGYTSNEAAQILSMKPTTVRSRLNRGLAKMRKDLEVE